MQANLPRAPNSRGRAWRNQNRRFINLTLAAIATFLVILILFNVSYLRSMGSGGAGKKRPALPHEVVIEQMAEKEELEAAIVSTTPVKDVDVAVDEPASDTGKAPPVTKGKHAEQPPTAAGGALAEKSTAPASAAPTTEEQERGYAVDSDGQGAANAKEDGSEKKADAGDSAAKASGEAEVKPEDIADAKEEQEEMNMIPKDSNSNKKAGLHFNDLDFKAAVRRYYDNLQVTLKANENPRQNTKSFLDVNEVEDDGVILPHDPSQVPDPKTYEACDNRDADFTPERDRLCQEYMSNVNNMKAIKALGSLLYSGRTIKFKVFYRHNGLQGVVKVSQEKFFFEAASEYLAYSVDRSLNFSYVPPTSFVSLPLDYMRAASATVSPFFSQWFEGFIPEYKYTQSNLVSCPEPSPYHAFLAANEGTDLRKGKASRPKPYETKCSQVAIQLWMKDVHSALDTNLAVPHEYSERFAKKYMRPFRMKNESVSSSHKHSKYTWPPSKPYRQQALGDLCDRMIFDYLIGNTDRGMNDHNNFVYGGCDDDTECKQPSPENRLKSKPKYAFIDHGSSFYSHKEPEGNPFTGNKTLICRYRRSTYDKMWYYHRENEKGYVAQHPDESRPFIHFAKTQLPKGLFNVIHMSVFKKVQDRLQKVVDIMDDCVDAFGEDQVFSL